MAPDRRPARPTVLAVGLGTAVVPFDSAVNIAFPDITASFGIAVADIQWLVIAYVLTHAALSLSGGRLGDVAGHARVFALGLALGIVAFLACAAAPSYGWLLVARVAQGVSAALIMSCGPALLTAGLDGADRSRALSLYGTIFAGSAALGPVLGGLLVDSFGWPAVYWVRAPVAVAAIIALSVAVRQGGWPRGDGGHFDIGTGLSLAIGLAGLLLAVNQLRGGQPLMALAMALAGVAGLWLVVRRERRSATPLLVPGIARDPAFLALSLLGALFFLSGFAVMLLLPFRIADWLGVATAGLLLAVQPIAMTVASTQVARLLARRPAATLCRVATLALISGLALVGAGVAWGQVPLIVTGLILTGGGTGVFQVAYLDAVVARLGEARRGVAGGLAMLTRMVGIVTGASVLTMINAAAGGGAAAFVVTLMTAAGLAAVALVIHAVVVVRRMPSM